MGTEKEEEEAGVLLAEFIVELEDLKLVYLELVEVDPLEQVRVNERVVLWIMNVRKL